MTPRKRIFFNNDEGTLISRDALVLLIDEIDNPCIVINSASGKIVCVNYAFTEATGFGNIELNGEHIMKFISDYVDSPEQNGKPIQGSIDSKSAKIIPIEYVKKGFSAEKNLSLIKIHQYAQQEKTNGSRKFNNVLINLCSADNLVDENQLLESFIHAAIGLFDLHDCVLYKPHQDELIRQTFSENFPSKLPLIEIERIKNLDFWYQSKRILCEIHRVSRRNGFSGVISAPVEISNERGLLIAVIDDWKRFSHIEPNFKTFIAWINRISNLSSAYQKINRKINWLQNQYGLYNELIEKASDAIALISEKNAIEFVNSKFLSRLGYSSFEVIGKDISEVIGKNALDGIFQSVSEGEQNKNSRVLIHDRLGNDLFVDAVIYDFLVEEKTSRILILRDATVEHGLSTSIKRIENLASLGESIADFAHDVRNPLNNISTGLQLLRKVFNDNQMLVDTVDRMQSDCIRLSDLIESVLSFSRQSPSAFVEMDLTEIVENVMKHFENSFKKYKITPAVSKKINEAKINGDYRSIERVLINLINNSVQAMESSGGELSIIIDENKQDQAEILISIADTGPGIPKDMQANIFEPYVTGKKTGTGLGLSITKRIIEAHNGKIELVSYTNGTIFRLFFKKKLEAKA